MKYKARSLRTAVGPGPGGGNSLYKWGRDVLTNGVDLLMNLSEKGYGISRVLRVID